MANRILVVDDEPALTFFLQQTLLAKGADKYQVQTAASGEEALQRLQSHSYDLLITDQKMPGIDGLQLIEAAHRIDPGIRTILMTAYGSEEVEDWARRQSVFRYLTKPFYVQDLRQAVHDALEDKSSPGEEATVARRLRELQSNIGCQCIFLADAGGQIVAKIGQVPSLDLQALAAVVTGRFAVTFEMARLLGSSGAYELNFYEGERYDVYSASVGDTLILTSVFDRRVQLSELGGVWHHTKRTINDLLIMQAIESTSAGPSNVAAEAPQRTVSDPAPAPQPRREANPLQRPSEVAEEPVLPDAGDRQLFSLDEARALGLVPQEFQGSDADDE